MDGTRLAPEPPVVRRNPGWEHLTKVYLAALKHGQNFKTASLRDFHLHVGIAFRVAVQELRKHAFNALLLRRLQQCRRK
jgi:hypothetical protein